MSELAKLTGVAQGTIFYHYINKEGLFIATLERIKKIILKRYDEYLDGQKFETGLEMTEGVISFYLHFPLLFSRRTARCLPDSHRLSI